MLESALGRIEYGDGGSLAGLPPGTGMLDGLEWPETAGRTDYISPVPVVPFALSTGCFWNRCLFCPDRTQPFRRIDNSALASLLETAPPPIRGRRPMVHFLDSALAPRFMREALPILVDHDADFYGFARPAPDLLEGDTLEQAAEAGCAMLQLGVESADAGLLDRFCKGTDPVSAARVLARASGLGIRTYAYFLFGLPGEGAGSRALTAEFIESNSSNIDFANLSVFNLPVNCELAERAEEFGIHRTRGVRGGDRIRLYIPFTEDGSAPRFEVRRFLAEAGVYGSGLRAIMTRTPRWFRAAHLAMLQLPGRGRG
jgi:radical SAM superfamily enzyme YgiQ (UPF0313 family)